MSDDLSRNEGLAKGLLAEEEGRGAERTSGRRPATDSHALLAALLEEERATERRLRRIALGSWAAVLALVPLLGVAFFVVRVSGGLIVEVTRAAAIVAGILAILALFLAVLTTVTWLFRSRTASLAVIERRLAALEELLARGR
jgi:hypothetical protein